MFFKNSLNYFNQFFFFISKQIKNFYLNSKIYNKKISKISNKILEYKPSPSLLDCLIKYEKKKIKIEDLYLNSVWSNKELAEKDYKNMKLIIGDSSIPVLRALGNPRYDMVMKTVDEFTKEHQLSVLSRNNRIIIGSSHKEDDEFLIPVLIKMMNTHQDLKILYAPHEPSNSEIKRIQSAFSEFGLEATVFGTPA